MNRQLIEEYVACGPRLRKAVAGLNAEDLTARPGPGKMKQAGGNSPACCGNCPTRHSHAAVRTIAVAQ